MGRHSRQLLALIAAALVGSLAAEGNTGPGEGLQQLAVTKYARVAGDPEARSAAARVAAAIDEAAPRIAPLVGTDDLRPVPALIYVNRGRFLAAVGLSSRSATVGVAILPAGVIHIDGTGRLASIERIVPHEVGHVMIARAVGGSLAALPLWLNEGIAEYVAGQEAAQVDPLALQAITRGTVLDLAELDLSLRPGGKHGGIAYAEAASLVHFLIDQRGEGVIAELLGQLRKEGRLAPALERVTGWSTRELESEWRRAVVRRWGLAMLLQSRALPFALMVLVFAAALVRFLMRRRRRRQMGDEEW